MADLSVVQPSSRNNAEWCDTFCRTHGVAGDFDRDAWSSRVRTPPLYPDAVTLAPQVDAADLLARIDTGGGCSIKDSFATLDLATHGFRPLITAEWVVADGHNDDASSRWSVIETPAQLEEWESAWGEADAPGFFRPGLLSNSAIALLARYDDGLVTAGAIANRSQTVIGVSNLFDSGGDLTSAWRTAAAAACARWGSLPVVGYGSGARLAAAQRAGFKSLGKLTIWAKPVDRLHG
jgi:hypothetical protein